MASVKALKIRIGSVKPTQTIATVAKADAATALRGKQTAARGVPAESRAA